MTDGIQYKQGLAAHDDRIVTAINKAIDRRTRHNPFFNGVAVINVKDGFIKGRTGLAETDPLITNKRGINA